MDVVNLADKFRGFTDAWSPRIVGDLNDMHVKVVKLRGEFVWHHHDTEDELFLVVAGRLRMQLRSGDRDLGPGEFIIVPHGTEHCPLALSDEVHVVLLEPKGTLNTGNVISERPSPDGSDEEQETAHSRSATAPPGRGAWGVWGAIRGPPHQTRLRRRGSSASRMESPSALMASTVTKMARPGNAVIHQADFK